ncbi:hypothetical protein BDW59DRAFT_146977, partial [Aspergillus cavernicola]
MGRMRTPVRTSVSSHFGSCSERNQIPGAWPTIFIARASRLWYFVSSRKHGLSCSSQAFEFFRKDRFAMSLLAWVGSILVEEGV